MSILENTEKGKGEMLRALFVPALLVAVGVGAFGLGRLSKIEESSPKTSVISYVSTTTAEKTEKVEQIQAAAEEKTYGSYVASRNGTSYYFPWCATAKRIADKNKVWFTTKEEAEKAGYKPAKNCSGLQ